MSTPSYKSLSAPFMMLCALTLTHCVTSDPTDVQGNDDNLRTVGDQGSTGNADMTTGGQDQGGIARDQGTDQGGVTRDQGGVTRDQGDVTADMGDVFDMDEADAARDMDQTSDMAGQEDMMVMPTPSKCRRLPETDGVRTVVAARPYDDMGAQASIYEVFTLDMQGNVMSTGKQFEMGRAFDGKIHFTPDGEIGVVRQEDGTIGIFKLDASNNVTVLDPGFAGLQAKIDPSKQRYFSTITLTNDGSAIIASNASWRNVGGSVWYIPLDCTTGMPGQEVQIAESKLPRRLQTLHNDQNRLVVASHDILTSMVRDDAHLIDLSTPTAPSLLGSGRIFSDDDAIVTAMAISEDDAYVLLGDSNLFGGSTTNHRIGVFSIDPNGVTPIQSIADVFDPADIVVSPWHNAALVSSFEGNALVLLDYDPNNTVMPFAKNGDVRTTTPSLLPSTMVMVRRGALTGTVLVGENTGIRTLSFTSTGDVVELRNANYGDELSDIIGALGVQP